ncbi:MaoC family dehydratase [uncultured Microbulbifer sp.]|uniref:MaoC family dehydratase n=1 Tax=uncultured Microbulbifer sp. TaxID=348147 RepID=UPI0025D5900D|nr:MaoC family dehydratase [uncultured Microbulbifer sp.]
MSTAIAVKDYASFIGRKTEATDWLKIGQERVNAFADCTLDHQFIHVDPEAAKQTPFGSTIAHGFLTLSLLSHFAEQLKIAMDGVRMGVNYGLDKVRFINPVKVGQRVRARGKILDIVEKSPGQFQLKLEITVEIEGEDKPALIAEWLVLQFV